MRQANNGIFIVHVYNNLVQSLQGIFGSLMEYTSKGYHSYIAHIFTIELLNQQSSFLKGPRNNKNV